MTVPHVDEKVGLDHGDCGDHGMDPTYHRMVWRATPLPQPPPLANTSEGRGARPLPCLQRYTTCEEKEKWLTRDTMDGLRKTKGKLTVI